MVAEGETQFKVTTEGIDRLAGSDEAFSTALNMRDGRLTNRPVAEAHGMKVG